MFLKLLILISCCHSFVSAGCRPQERKACESICQKDSHGQLACELRGAIILPNSTKIEASMPRVSPVIEMAEKRIRADGILPDYVKISWMKYDDQCDVAVSTISVMDAYTKDCSHFVVGPSCEFCASSVSRIAKYFYNDGLNIITAGGFSYDFEEKKTSCSDQFHMLTRAGVLSFERIATFTADLMRNFNWKRAAFIYDRNGYFQVGGSQTCHLMMSSMAKVFRASNITYSPFVMDMATEDIQEDLKREVGNEHSIIMMCANPKSIREIMIAAEELKMIEGEYVFFNIEIFGSLTKESKPWLDVNDTSVRNMQAKKAYQALLTITTKKPEDEEYHEFSDQVKLLAKEKYNYTFDEHEEISQFVSAFHDAVLLFARALNSSIKELGHEALLQPLNGTRLTELMWGTTFRGITGNVSIDSNGDRLSDYSLLDLNPETGHFENVANYFHSTGLTFVEGKKIHWAGGRTEPPADRPVCGFDNSLCPENTSKMFAILSIVLSFVVVIMAVISFVSYRHYRLEAEISSMTWKVNWNEVILVPVANQMRNSIHSRAGSQLSVYSEDLMNNGQIFIPIGCYKGNTVAMKKIFAPINLTRPLMVELKAMKDIQHDHLVRFCGAVIDSVPCLLTEYCSKGSLQDILENHEINLDWMFKLSLMHDIVKGMHYLHTTSIHSHGQLKSSNCVVDSRFVLKITDFGLHDLRKTPSEDTDNKESHEYWKKFLWTAPELLRLPAIPDEGTQKGDVYSFAIIVQEIVSRQGVFFLGNNTYLDRTPKEIIQLVCSPTSQSHPFRPIVEDNKETCCDINALMVRCWSEDPNTRPDFSAIKSVVRKINKENESGNILDNLLKRMEHYTLNLESLVEERTRDYFEEKKKCEELLYQLLPISIASQLITGKPVMAEMYENVTIYFSDIVGFTTISAESTPMQVVDLLNDLYTVFDKIVGHFDVYKVETIGDAYMVVSGLPVRNGDLHAREIARMAIALLSKVHTFVIHHRPTEKLKLRIGLHSGPCCAGIVGQKMPRYCLFGDTVNTASRMESNGEALKIHMSHSTKQILDRFGTFDVTMRGFVSIKGKGEMMTFWLNGEKSDTTPVHLNGEANVLQLEKWSAVPNDLKPAKTVAIVQPLTQQSSFNSKKCVKINTGLNNNNNLNNSLKELAHPPLANGKKTSFFGKKKQGLNSDNLQPLLSKIK